MAISPQAQAKKEEHRMKEAFSSLGALMDYYQFLKFDVATCPTILPKKDFFYGDMPHSKKSQSSREERLAFIADVERFVYHYANNQKCHVPLPIDCVYEVFYFELAEHVWLHMVFPNLKYTAGDMDRIREKYLTYGQLARRFRIKASRASTSDLNKRVPKRLTYRQHLRAVCQDIRREAWRYFEEKGLIIKKEETDEELQHEHGE
jgi:hypothetical protein